MICTVTFNPSLDYIIRVNGFRTGTINRTTYERIFAGGKGINVSTVLRSLGHASTAYGFTAGFTGQEIRHRLETSGITARFIEAAEGLSRINVKMKSDEETEINGQGPHLSEENINELFRQLNELQKDDILVISGSIPSSLPDDMYERIMNLLAGRGIKIVVDAAGKLLSRVLPCKPFLVKPNNHELGGIFNVELHTREEAVPYALKLKEAGAANVLVSMAGEGAVLVSEHNEIFACEAPQGTVVNSVGAGDSMVAGFIAGYLESNGDYRTAFETGIAAGSASAFSEELASREETERLRTMIHDRIQQIR